MPNYTIAIAIPGQQRDRITAAYKAAGLTPPWPDVDPILAALDAEPNDADLQAAAIRPTTPEALLELSQRVLIANAARTAYRNNTSHRDAAAATDDTNNAASAIAAKAKALVGDLEKIAAQLPEQPLDRDAIYETDCSKQARTAEQHLRTLAAFAGIYDTTGVRHQTVSNVIDWPDVEPAAYHRQTHHLLNPSAERSGAQKFIDDFNPQDLDALLLRVARGDYPGVSLKVPASTDEHDANRERLRTLETADYPTTVTGDAVFSL